MANMFDIFSRKSGRSVEVSENEQMNTVSPRTPSAGDNLHTQGVNNDNPFENKDGAKVSGNYAYGVDSRHEAQETTSLFTIPKLKRSKQDPLMEISTDSREWQQEVLPVLTKYFRFPGSSARFEFLRVSLVQNSERMQKYLEKRKAMRQNGYSDRDVADSFAFLCVEDEKQIDRICKEGMRIGNLSSSTIGHPRMGAQLCRYMDTIHPAGFLPGSTSKLFVFKVMKGKVKAVTENRTGLPLEPTPNYDCHMAKSSLDVTPASHQQLYELYQIYLYEYGEDMTVESYPRHVLPYAVISFRYKDAPPSPRMLESPPMLSQKLASPPIPKATISAPKEENDPEYVIWCGHLRVKELLDCQVKMVSTASQYKPAHLGTVLNVRDTCPMKIAGERYFREMSCLRKSGEVYWKGWYINVAELRPRPDSKVQFQRLMNHLNRTTSMAVLKPENEVILLLVPNCQLTHELGLTRPHHYPVMFHCIFLSRTSSKFKSPSYLQKRLLNRCSGSSTPSRLDSGQMSPITINVHPSSRPSTAPGSPALLLSPPSALAARSGSDRSPGFGSSPRNELAVWTGVHHELTQCQILGLRDDENKASGNEKEDQVVSNKEHKADTNSLVVHKTESDENSEELKEACDVQLCVGEKQTIENVNSVEKEDSVDPEKNAEEARILSVPNPFCFASSGFLACRRLLSVSTVFGDCGSADYNVVSKPGGTVLPSVDVSCAVSSVCTSSCSSGLGPFAVSPFSSFPRCLLSPTLSRSPSLFPTPPLLSPSSLQSSGNVEGTISQSKPTSQPLLSSGGKPVRPLLIPKLVLPEHQPSSQSPIGPYSPISPASVRSPQPYSPISPASAHSGGPSISSENVPLHGPYSPITPVTLPPLGPYSPISPVELPSVGPYSPISPAANTRVSGISANFMPQLSSLFMGSHAQWPTVTSSQFLSVASPLSSTPWTMDRFSSSPWECNASLLSVAEKSGDGTRAEQLASKEGTNALSVGRSVGSLSSSVSQNTELDERGDVPALAHSLMRLHRSLSTDLASQDSPDKSIPLGYDEGFLSSMPNSARINRQKLKNAFQIQHRIQESMEPASADPMSSEFPSSEGPLELSPASVREQKDDVEQDDTITSSTSLDPSGHPSTHHRSASTDAAFSPDPSPENVSEPDETVVDLGIHSESSLLTIPKERSLLSVPKESRSRTKSLYLPSRNIPEYKPTPLYEPSPKRYKMEEGSRHSSSVPSMERGPAQRGSVFSSSLSYGSSTPKVPSFGLTHVRSPRDLPLPISPADSSTDKVKSPSPTSSNIATANDMKNFLNASLERKPSARPSPSLSRSRSALPENRAVSGFQLSCLSDHCALSHHASLHSAISTTSQSRECFGTSTTFSAGVGTASSQMPSVIVSIPYSHLHHLPVAQPFGKESSQAVYKSKHVQNLDFTRRPGIECHAENSKASIIVQIHPSALRRAPKKLSSLKCSDVVTGKRGCEGMKKCVIQSCKDMEKCVDQSTQSKPTDPCCVGNDEDNKCDNSKLKKHCAFSVTKSSIISHLNYGGDNFSYFDNHMQASLYSQEDRYRQSKVLQRTRIHPHQPFVPHHQHDEYSDQQEWNSHTPTGKSHMSQEDQSCCDMRQMPETLAHPDASFHTVAAVTASSASNHYFKHDQLLQNADPSIPVDVLELINRLKTVAKERMIEEAVAKLFNLQRNNNSSKSSVHSDLLDDSARIVDGEDNENRCEDGGNVFLQDFEAQSSGREVKAPLCQPDTRSTLSHGFGKGLSIADREDFDFQHDQQISSAIYLDSQTKPVVESQELSSMGCKDVSIDPYEIETDIDVSSDESSDKQYCSADKGIDSKHMSEQSPVSSGENLNDKPVSPLLIQRQSGTMEDDFRIVKTLSRTMTCIKNNSGRKAKSKITERLKIKEFTCKMKKLIRGHWYKRKPTIKQIKHKRKRSARERLNVVETNERQTVLVKQTAQQSTVGPTRTSELSERPVVNILASPQAAEGNSSTVFTTEIDSSIAGVISSDIDPVPLEEDPVMFDSGVVVEQNDLLSSECSSPQRDTDNELCDKTHLHGDNVLVSCTSQTPFTNCLVSQKQMLHGTVCKQSVQREPLANSKPGKKKRRPYKNARKGIAVVPVKDPSMQNETSDDSNELDNTASAKDRKNPYVCKGQQSLTKGIPIDLEVSQESCAPKEFEAPYPYCLKPCSVVLCDCLTAGLQLNAKGSCLSKSSMVKHTNTLNHTQSPEAVKKPRANKNKHLSNVLKGSQCASPKSQETIVLTRSPADVAVSASNVVECLRSESGVEEKKRSTSQQSCQPKRSGSSDYLKNLHGGRKLQTQCKKSGQSGIEQSSAVLSTDKVEKTNAGRPIRGQGGARKKSSTITAGRKLKASVLERRQRICCAAKSNSWHDVLQEMNLLSASSCTNKAPPEPSRNMLPRIPKKKKPPKDSAVTDADSNVALVDTWSVSVDSSVPPELSSSRTSNGQNTCELTPCEEKTASLSHTRQRRLGQFEESKTHQTGQSRQCKIDHYGKSKSGKTGLSSESVKLHTGREGFILKKSMAGRSSGSQEGDLPIEKVLAVQARGQSATSACHQGDKGDGIHGGVSVECPISEHFSDVYDGHKLRHSGPRANFTRYSPFPRISLPGNFKPDHPTSGHKSSQDFDKTILAPGQHSNGFQPPQIFSSQRMMNNLLDAFRGVQESFNGRRGCGSQTSENVQNLTAVNCPSRATCQKASQVFHLLRDPRKRVLLQNKGYAGIRHPVLFDSASKCTSDSTSNCVFSETKPDYPILSARLQTTFREREGKTPELVPSGMPTEPMLSGHSCHDWKVTRELQSSGQPEQLGGTEHHFMMKSVVPQIHDGRKLSLFDAADQHGQPAEQPTFSMLNTVRYCRAETPFSVTTSQEKPLGYGLNVYQAKESRNSTLREGTVKQTETALQQAEDVCNTLPPSTQEMCIFPNRTDISKEQDSCGVKHISNASEKSTEIRPGNGSTSLDLHISVGPQHTDCVQVAANSDTCMVHERPQNSVKDLTSERTISRSSVHITDGCLIPETVAEIVADSAQQHRNRQKATKTDISQHSVSSKDLCKTGAPVEHMTVQNLYETDIFPFLKDLKEAVCLSASEVVLTEVHQEDMKKDLIAGEGLQRQMGALSLKEVVQTETRLVQEPAEQVAPQISKQVSTVAVVSDSETTLSFQSELQPSEARYVKDTADLNIAEIEVETAQDMTTDFASKWTTDADVNKELSGSTDNEDLCNDGKTEYQQLTEVNTLECKKSFPGKVSEAMDSNTDIATEKLLEVPGERAKLSPKVLQEKVRTKRLQNVADMYGAEVISRSILSEMSMIPVLDTQVKSSCRPADVAQRVDRGQVVKVSEPATDTCQSLQTNAQPESPASHGSCADISKHGAVKKCLGTKCEEKYSCQENLSAVPPDFPVQAAALSVLESAAAVASAPDESVAPVSSSDKCSAGLQSDLPRDLAPGEKSTLKDVYGSEYKDEETFNCSLSDFTVVDECGYPDVVDHASLRQSLGSQNASSCREYCRLPLDGLLEFADTGVKAHDENKRYDTEQKEKAVNNSSQVERSKSQLSASKGSLPAEKVCNRSPELKQDTHGLKLCRESRSGNRRRKKSKSPNLKHRAQSRSPHSRSRSKSPRYKRKASSQSPVARRALSRSPYKKRGSRSPTDMRRGRSRSPLSTGSMSPNCWTRDWTSDSRAYSPYRRRDSGRQSYYTRGRDKEQIVEDRHYRQYHPYSGRHGRDGGRSGNWDRHRRQREENKPDASFDLAYRELSDLLADKTSETFQSRRTKRNQTASALFSDKRYKGCRFRGYRFRRSLVPSNSEYEVLDDMEERTMAEKSGSDISSSEEEQKDDKERVLIAQALDEMLGETDTSCQKDQGQSAVESPHVRSFPVISSSNFVLEEVQGSPLPTNPGDDDNKSWSKSVSDGTESPASCDDVKCDGDSRKVVLSRDDSDDAEQKRLPSVTHVSQVFFRDGCHDSAEALGWNNSFQHSQVGDQSNIPKVCIGTGIGDKQQQKCLKQEEHNVRKMMKKVTKRNLDNLSDTLSSQLCHEYGNNNLSEKFCFSKRSEIEKQGNADSFASPGLLQKWTNRYGEISDMKESNVTEVSAQTLSSDPKDLGKNMSWCSFDTLSNQKDILNKSTSLWKPISNGPRTPPGLSPEDLIEHQCVPQASNKSVIGPQTPPEPKSGLRTPLSNHHIGRVQGRPNVQFQIRASSKCLQPSRQIRFKSADRDCQSGDSRPVNRSQTGRRRTRTNPESDTENQSPLVPLSDIPSREGTALSTDSREESYNLQSLPSVLSASDMGASRYSTFLKMNSAELGAASSQTLQCRPQRCPLTVLPDSAVGKDFSASLSSPCVQSQDSGGNISGINGRGLAQDSFCGLPSSAAKTPVSSAPTSGSNQKVSFACTQHPASCNPSPSDVQRQSNAKGEMDRLVRQIRVYLATVEMNTNSEQNRSPELLTSLDPSAVGQRSPQPANEVAWKLNPWPGTPPPITFEKRIADYRPNPSLSEDDKQVEVAVSGQDPRLDPDRPPFVPAGKSEQARERAKKWRISSGIKVVKAIPLEPVHKEGRCPAKDPRHAVRSSVADVDHEFGCRAKESDSEYEKSSGTDVDEKSDGGPRTYTVRVRDHTKRHKNKEKECLAKADCTEDEGKDSVSHKSDSINRELEDSRPIANEKDSNVNMDNACNTELHYVCAEIIPGPSQKMFISSESSNQVSSSTPDIIEVPSINQTSQPGDVEHRNVTDVADCSSSHLSKTSQIRQGSRLSRQVSAQSSQTRKRPLVSSSLQSVKKNCVTACEEACAPDSSPIEMSNRCKVFSSTPWRPAAATVLNHNEALNEELLKDVMHLDSGQQQNDQNVETGVTDGYNIAKPQISESSALSFSGPAVLPSFRELARSLQRTWKKPAGEPMTIDFSRLPESAAGQMSVPVTTESSQPGTALRVGTESLEAGHTSPVEVLEILSSSDCSELEEGEIKDSPPKVKYLISHGHCGKDETFENVLMKDISCMKEQISKRDLSCEQGVGEETRGEREGNIMTTDRGTWETNTQVIMASTCAPNRTIANCLDSSRNGDNTGKGSSVSNNLSLQESDAKGMIKGSSLVFVGAESSMNQTHDEEPYQCQPGRDVLDDGQDLNVSEQKIHYVTREEIVHDVYLPVSTPGNSSSQELSDQIAHRGPGNSSSQELSDQIAYRGHLDAQCQTSCAQLCPVHISTADHSGVRENERTFLCSIRDSSDQAVDSSIDFTSSCETDADACQQTSSMSSSAVPVMTDVTVKENLHTQSQSNPEASAVVPVERTVTTRTSQLNISSCRQVGSQGEEVVSAPLICSETQKADDAHSALSLCQSAMELKNQHTPSIDLQSFSTVECSACSVETTGSGCLKQLVTFSSKPTVVNEVLSSMYTTSLETANIPPLQESVIHVGQLQEKDSSQTMSLDVYETNQPLTTTSLITPQSGPPVLDINSHHLSGFPSHVMPTGCTVSLPNSTSVIGDVGALKQRMDMQGQHDHNLGPITGSQWYPASQDFTYRVEPSPLPSDSSRKLTY